MIQVWRRSVRSATNDVCETISGHPSALHHLHGVVALFAATQQNDPFARVEKWLEGTPMRRAASHAADGALRGGVRGGFGALRGGGCGGFRGPQYALVVSPLPLPRAAGRTAWRTRLARSHTGCQAWRGSPCYRGDQAACRSRGQSSRLRRSRFGPSRSSGSVSGRLPERRAWPPRTCTILRTS